MLPISRVAVGAHCALRKSYDLERQRFGSLPRVAARHHALAQSDTIRFSGVAALGSIARLTGLAFVSDVFSVFIAGAAGAVAPVLVRSARRLLLALTVLRFATIP